MRRVFRWLLLAFVVLAGLAYAYSGYLVHQHRAAVKERLNDPDSAKFQGEHLRGGYTLKSSILCGEVNAKNQMGGYAGYVPFAAIGSTRYAEVAFSDIDLELVKAYCE